jgi:putative NADH-flavin reductase
MKIAVAGARGRAGSRIAAELRSRGHEVIGLVRSASAIALDGVSEIVDDLSDPELTALNLAGAAALVSACAPPPEATGELVAVTRRLIAAVRTSGTPRLLVVGGAGTLEVAPGITLLDSGSLPPEWRAIAEAHATTLALLAACPIDWTYFAPAAYFDPGPRTCSFRLGTDKLIADASGQSRISMEDYAIAMADEIERPRHRRARMTIGY